MIGTRLFLVQRAVANVGAAILGRRRSKVVDDEHADHRGPAGRMPELVDFPA